MTVAAICLFPLNLVSGGIFVFVARQEPLKFAYLSGLCVLFILSKKYVHIVAKAIGAERITIKCPAPSFQRF